MLTTSLLAIRAEGGVFYQKPAIPMKKFIWVSLAILLAVFLQILGILTLNIVMIHFDDVLYGLFSNRIANQLVQFGFIFFLMAMLEKGIQAILDPINNSISEIFLTYIEKLRLINYYHGQSASRFRKDIHSINKTKLYFLRLVQHLIRIIILLLALPILIVMFLLYLEHTEAKNNQTNNTQSSNQHLESGSIDMTNQNDEENGEGKEFKLYEAIKKLKFGDHKHFIIFIVCSLLFYMSLGIAVAFINSSKSASSPVLEPHHLNAYRSGAAPEQNIVVNLGKFTNIFIVNSLKPVALLLGLLAYGYITSLSRNGNNYGTTFINKYKSVLWIFLLHILCVICIESTKATVFAQLYSRRTVQNQHTIETLRINEWPLYRRLKKNKPGRFLPQKLHSRFKDYLRNFTSEGNIPAKVTIVKIIRNSMTIADYFKTVTRDNLSSSEILSYLNQTNAMQLLHNTHLCPLETTLDNSALNKEILNNIALSAALAVDPSFDLIMFGIPLHQRQLQTLRNMREDDDYAEVLVITAEGDD